MAAKNKSEAEARPAGGGSFVRQADGSLKQIEGTKPAPSRSDAKPSKPGAQKPAGNAPEAKKKEGDA